MHSYISHNLKNTLKDKFLLPLGQTDEGCLQVADFFELEHILIGGDKDKLESYLKFIIQNLSSKYSSEELQFIINTHDKSIFCEFKNLPHLYRGKINSLNNQVSNLRKTVINFQNFFNIDSDFNINAKEQFQTKYNYLKETTAQLISYINKEISKYKKAVLTISNEIEQVNKQQTKLISTKSSHISKS